MPKIIDLKSLQFRQNGLINVCRMYFNRFWQWAYKLENIDDCKNRYFSSVSLHFVNWGTFSHSWADERGILHSLIINWLRFYFKYLSIKKVPFKLRVVNHVFHFLIFSWYRSFIVGKFIVYYAKEFSAW